MSSVSFILCRRKHRTVGVSSEAAARWSGEVGDKVFTYKYFSSGRNVFNNHNNQPLCQDTLVEPFGACPVSFVLVILYFYIIITISFFFTIKYLLNSLSSLQGAERQIYFELIWDSWYGLLKHGKEFQELRWHMADIFCPFCHSLAWLHQNLSAVFMVCLLTDKQKSDSQVCKLNVNSGVICQLTAQRNCLQQQESSLTHTDISCAGHAALGAKCCCKRLCCSFCHSACGSSQETSGGCG